MAHGQITHIEFPADDTDRARRFYSELFGWEFNAMEGFDGYFMFNTGSAEAIGGAVGGRGNSVGERTRPYIETDSIEAVLARVPELGGRVVTGKTDIPGQGSFAVIHDSEGNELGLFEGLPQG
ncbi:MAG TPA: VOC family protein [Candidatus Limnocylindria bacterium]|nr:VOC family protein [Candidatus Limnocylindria bacterium]